MVNPFFDNPSPKSKKPSISDAMEEFEEHLYGNKKAWRYSKKSKKQKVK